MEELAREYDFSQMSMIHFSPMPFSRERFRKMFGQYTTADLGGDHVDCNADLRSLPFERESWDVVFASHVLEHIPEDHTALSEIRRVLRSGGFAVLPVPVIAEKTVEYAEPNATESEHVRAVGVDYFDRYAGFFSRVKLFCSNDYPEEYQTFLHEDRSRWPSPESPLRPRMCGDRHADYVPVCFA